MLGENEESTKLSRVIKPLLEEFADVMPDEISARLSCVTVQYCIDLVPGVINPVGLRIVWALRSMKNFSVK